MGELFALKALHWGTNFFGQIYGGIFYMRTNDQITQGGKLMAKRYQRSNQVSFFLLTTLIWVIDVLFEKLAPKIGD